MFYFGCSTGVSIYILLGGPSAPQSCVRPPNDALAPPPNVATSPNRFKQVLSHSEEETWTIVENEEFIHTLKNFLWWTGKIFIRVANYIRRHSFGHHHFKRAPVPISLFLSFIESPMNGQLLKASNPSLFCEDFENRREGFWKFWSSRVLARDVMVATSKMYWFWHIRHKCDSSDENQLFFLFHIHYFTFYTSFRAGDVLPLTVLAPARVKYHVGSVSPTSLKSP